MTTLSIKPAGQARREAEEQNEIAIEASRHMAKPKAPPPPPPARHPDPVIARFIAQAEALQAGYPEATRLPFLRELNLMLGLAHRHYAGVGDTVPVATHLLKTLDLDNKSKARLAEIWLDYRKMASASEAFGEVAVRPELERRRAALLENPSTAKTVLNVAEETLKIRNEFRERRIAYQESWCLRHAVEFHDTLLRLLTPALSEIEQTIHQFHGRMITDSTRLGFQRENLPPDLATLSLCLLYSRVHSYLVAVVGAKDGFADQLRRGESRIHFSIRQDLLELFGVQELPIA